MSTRTRGGGAAVYNKESAGKKEWAVMESPAGLRVGGVAVLSFEADGWRWKDTYPFWVCLGK